MLEVDPQASDPPQAANGAAASIPPAATGIAELDRLEAVSQHLAAIVENSNDAIISKDLNGIVTSWNHAAESTFGYTAAEIVGRPISILAVPDRPDEMPGILSKIRQGQRIKHFETRRRRKDGQIVDIELTVSPVCNAAGQIVGASKIARDITDRKLAEKERALLLAREREARRTAELLNLVAARLGAQLDIHKLVQEMTDTATALVGAELGSFFRNPVNEDEPYVPPTLSGVLRDAFACLPALRSTNPLGAAFGAARVVRCDDVTRDPRFSNNPPYDAMPNGRLPLRSYLAASVVARSGEVLGTLAFAHSTPGMFTETHQAMVTGVAAQAAIAMDNARLFEEGQWVQTELKRTNQELRRANQDLEIFAYSASHDLQEPLRTIAISAQIVQRNWGRGLQAEDATFLANILAASHQMSVLIGDLLAYTNATKYAEGSVPNVDSALVLSNVLESLQGTIEEASATVTSAGLPMVAIHEARLAQLFQNLICNALKYRGKEPPRVHITARESDGWCVFSVIDNGIGVEAQYAEQIFGLFKRLHGRQEYPGSGIGLALCQRVVEQYGGRIWLDRPTPGGGSTFCFALPSRTG
jgi:PAS domain S-box-containing protein